ncbi:site-specific integrase [Pseudonocardia sp.]|uniref:tyrosine-type recombinase/integrase n=1 Tax=Pseudonocardia sp. TaxID=60912 RepID=UPI00262849BE|nr:site-specific integrase [Pseudonocardia sp.]
MKIHTTTHRTARREGKPLKTFKLRWEETLRDPHTGQPERTADGAIRKRSRSETYPTFDAADARRREIENQRAATGTVVGREAKLEPFGTFAAAWLDSLTGMVKARTLAEYGRLYRTYVAPEFGTRPIGSVTTADARRFRAGLVKRGLARSTVKQVFDVFRRVLDVALTDGAIPANPAASVPNLRRSATGDDEPFTPHPLSGDQVGAVAESIRARVPLYGLVVLFLAYTGLRAAELAGLEIRDVTLETPSPSISVRRTKRKVRGGWETGTPKSRKSRRVVPLDGWLADDLRAYLDTHARADEPTAPLFPARYGRNAVGMLRKVAEAPDTFNWAAPLEPGTFYAHYLMPAFAAAGLPVSTPARSEEDGTEVAAVRGVRLHDLRHTFAVLSLTSGAHYMQVSKWLGHESFVTTLTIYGDYIPEDEGGKAVPLARPSAPAPTPTAAPNGNVIAFRRRSAG